MTRRAVVSATWFTARSLLQSWRAAGRHWQLTLECGHVETRPMRYTGRAEWGSTFSLAQAKPAPRRVICHTCKEDGEQ